MRSKSPLVLFLCLSFGLVEVALADSVLFSAPPIPNPPSLSGQSLSFQQHQYLAQPFGFTGAISLSAISLYFHDNPNGSFNATLFITTAIGSNATPMNIVTSTTFAVPAGTAPASVTIPLSLNLSSGTYFIVISTNDPLPSESRWITSTIGPNAFAGGGFFSQSQDIGFPVGSNFLPIGGSTVLAFDLIGSGQFSTPVPEPATAVLLLSGVLPIAIRLRKAR